MFDYTEAISIIFTGRARTEAFSFSSKFVIVGDRGICDPRLRRQFLMKTFLLCLFVHNVFRL